MDKYGYLWPFRFSQAALMVTNKYIWTGMDSCFGKGALGAKDRMSFMESFFLFFFTFLCPADWREGGKISEPCDNHLCRSGTEYCHVKNTLLLLPKRTINSAYTGDHINPHVSILIRMCLYVVSICDHN